MGRPVSALFVLSSILTAMLSGCISSREHVSIAIQGSDRSLVNSTVEKGFGLTIKNEDPRQDTDLVVRIEVPSGIQLNPRFGEGSISPTQASGQWAYVFPAQIGAGLVADFVFDYRPEIPLSLFDAGGEYEYHITVQALDQKGAPLGSMTTQWTVELIMET